MSEPLPHFERVGTLISHKGGVHDLERLPWWLIREALSRAIQRGIDDLCLPDQEMEPQPWFERVEDTLDPRYHIVVVGIHTPDSFVASLFSGQEEMGVAG